MKTSGTLHFTVGEGIDRLVRQAYWYENRQEWAMSVLDCLNGITQVQKMDVLNGDAQLRPVDNNTRLQLIYEQDFDFKAELHKHQKWLSGTHIMIGNKQISKYLHDQYFENLRKMYIWRKRSGIGLFDRLVKMIQKSNNHLHDLMFEEAGFKFQDHRPVIHEWQIASMNQFEDTFKNYVATKLKEWEDFENGKHIKPKESLLASEDMERATVLHDELVAFCYGDNPRPELRMEETALALFDEVADLVDKYKELFNEFSFPSTFLQKKNLNRRMVKDCMDYLTLDSVRATIHSMIVEDDTHGGVWKEEKETTTFKKREN